jgi:hypothetical protein
MFGSPVMAKYEFPLSSHKHMANIWQNYGKTMAFGGKEQFSRRAPTRTAHGKTGDVALRHFFGLKLWRQ